MSPLCDLLVLLLEFDHVVLQLEDLLLLGIVYVLHLDDPILEDFVGFLELLDSLLKAGNRFVLFDCQGFDAGVFAGKLLTSPYLFSQSSFYVLVLGPEDL
jgi:hypothetical protein